LLQASARILLTSGETPPVLARTKVSAASGVKVQKQQRSSSSSSGPEVTNTAANRPGSVENNLFSSGGLGFSASESSVSAQEQETSPSHSDSSPLNLYDYLVDVVGEGLTLSLTPAAHAEEQGPSTKTTPSKTEPSKPEAVTRVNHSLEEFLSREGLRPIRVQLPHKAAPPPSVPRGYYRGRKPWTFHIPQPVLPTGRNVLEQLLPSNGTSLGTDTPAVVKGKCQGHHRCYRRKNLVDIASYWL
jgi:hypothetical protein